METVERVLSHSDRPPGVHGDDFIVSATAPDAVLRFVGRSRRAAEDHASRTLAERARLLGRLRRALLARADRFVELIHQECGRPLAEIWLHEIVTAAEVLAYWEADGPAELAGMEREARLPTGGTRAAIVERVPRGVIGVITPYTEPLALPVRLLAPALLAGNGAVLKPSELTPQTGALLIEACREVFGDHLASLVYGDAPVGQALVRGGVDAVAFVGSTAAGKDVAAAAGEQGLPVSLCLDGNDAAIVFDDASVPRTARGILWAAMHHTGQDCAALRRVFGSAKILGPLGEELARGARELVPDRDYGPLVREEHVDLLDRQVREAVTAGATVLAGGERLDREGGWYAPTVLANVPPDAAIVADGAWGPVVSLVPIESVADAVIRINEGARAYATSLWTRRPGRAEAVVRRLRVGVVSVNDHGGTRSAAALPYSGAPSSGFGALGSPAALELMTRPRVLVAEAEARRRELWWFPYGPGLERVGRAMGAWRRGGPLRTLGAAASLLLGRARRYRG